MAEKQGFTNKRKKVSKNAPFSPSVSDLDEIQAEKVAMMKKTYFVTCPYCGSNNDPGERCTCQEGGEQNDRSNKLRKGKRDKKTKR